MKILNEKNKGITLVALVITIIILLILAGITISQLTGSGLFENAKLAREKSDTAQEQEDEKLADYENKIGEYIKNDRNSQNNNSNFVELISTFEENIATFQYPEGYNKDSTYVISSKAFRPEGNIWYTRYSSAGITTNRDVISLIDTEIRWNLTNSGVTCTDAKILIMKIDV